MAATNMTREVRFFLTEELHEWLKATALDSGCAIGPFVRNLVGQEKDRIERRRMVRRTDPLIEEIHPLVKSIAEKLGVEQPDSEGENSAEKEGAEVPPKCGT